MGGDSGVERWAVGIALWVCFKLIQGRNGGVGRVVSVVVRRSWARIRVIVEGGGELFSEAVDRVGLVAGGGED